MSPNVEVRQHDTAKARAAFKQKFKSDAERIDHYRRMAEQSNRLRITLNAEEAATLVAVYDALGAIVARHRAPESEGRAS